jgi:hypothetical protein
MSVKINFKPSSNEAKWNLIKSGDFAVLEGTQENPIPQGLYRIFVAVDEKQQKTYLLTPLFDGPFEDGMFPYMVTNMLPKLIQPVSKLHIEAEQ